MPFPPSHPWPAAWVLSLLTARHRGHAHRPLFSLPTPSYKLVKTLSDYLSFVVPDTLKLGCIWLLNLCALVCASRWLPGGGPPALGPADVSTGRLCTSLCWGRWVSLVPHWFGYGFLGLGFLRVVDTCVVWLSRVSTSLSPPGRCSATSLCTRDRECSVSSRVSDRDLFVCLVLPPRPRKPSHGGWLFL